MNYKPLASIQGVFDFMPPVAQRWMGHLQDLFPKISTYTVTLNPAAVVANSTAEQTFTVTGLRTTDIVTVNKPTHSSGLGIMGARVSADDTLAITFANVTGGTVDPPSEDYLISAIRR